MTCHDISFVFQSSTRKSALLSAAKKAKLKSNPSRVRFAESVDINGSPLHNVSQSREFKLESRSLFPKTKSHPRGLNMSSGPKKRTTCIDNRKQKYRFDKFLLSTWDSTRTYLRGSDQGFGTSVPWLNGFPFSRVPVAPTAR